MIRHTVVFRLKHKRDSPEERSFLERSMVLADLPTVQKFEQLRQVSPKTNYHFGFSMEFSDQAAYDAYGFHPIHVAYVRDIWLTEVTDFMEIDYVAV